MGCFMRKLITILSCLLPITACTPPYNYQSPHDQIVQKCTEAGYKDKEFDDCVTSATKAYNEELAKQQKAEAAEIERRNKESIRMQKEAKARQLAEDSGKCKDYGFKRGTKDFAACMMQIEQARKQDQQLQQTLATQQAIANQQIEANERAAAAQRLQNYFLQQQAIQAQQNIANQNAIANMRRNNVNCTSYRNGNYTNTNCY